jgi:hypothetical protein
MFSTVWISAVIYHVTHVCMSSCNFGVWASMDNGHIVFQTCENIARLTYANSQLPLLCEFFLIPATLLVFRFNHLLSWVGPYNWNVVYREQDMFLLHLIASCLDDQILGLPRPLKGPMGLFSPGIAMEHLGSTIRRPNPLGKKYALKNLGQQPANERWMGHFWHRKPLEMTMAYQHGQRKWTTTTFFSFVGPSRSKILLV